MNRKNIWLLVLLYLPVLGALVLVVDKQLNREQSAGYVVVMKGYDPRDLLYGHFIRFTTDDPHVPKNSYSYFVPEAEAPVLDRILRKRQHQMSVEAYVGPGQEVHFGPLFIEGIAWRDYLRQHPEENQP